MPEDPQQAEPSDRGPNPAAFALLCGVGLCAIFSSTMSKSPVLPLFAQSLGAKDAGLGLIAAASTYTGIILSIPAGVLSDRLGRRTVLLASGLVFATAPFLYLFVHSTGALAAVRAYHGIATAVFGPVALAYVAELAPVRRGQRMGLFSSATLIGRSLAPMAGGLLLAYGFAPVYMGCAVAGVLALGLAMALPRPRGGAEPGALEDAHTPHWEGGDAPRLRDSWQQAREGLRQTIRSRVILGASGAEATIYLCFGAVETFVPVHAIECGVSKWQVGAIFMAQILTIALTKPILGGISDRIGRRGVITGGLVIGAAAVAALSSASDVWAMGLSVAVFGLALSAVTSATSALVSDASKAQNYGAALGVLSTIMDVGHSTGPVLAGALIGTVAYAGSFRIIAALPVIASVLVLWASRDRRATA